MLGGEKRNLALGVMCVANLSGLLVQHRRF
jgi:hypothetical protein